tara:strand:- start:433 stop:855 length:423 start_codon:yes stop_codon:yes gene_type:complete
MSTIENANVTTTNIRATNVQDASGGNGTTPAQLATGRAQFWIRFDGSSGSIGTGTNSFNVASVTDIGTGNYTVNIATNMDNANWVSFGQAGVTGNTMTTCIDMESSRAMAAGSCSYRVTDMAGTAVDATNIGIAGVGDPV